MHHIQKHILRELIDHPSRRYSQLRPENMEPNQFVYHLKQLIQAGLVHKTEGGDYDLTQKGRSFADKATPGTYELPWDTQPRIVLFAVIKDEEGRWLLRRRDKQPTLGKIGFTTPNMEFNEPIAQTAAQFMESEYDIICDFEYRMSGSVTLFHAGKETDTLESYVCFHLLYAEYTGPATKPDLDWYTKDQLADTDMIPNVAILLDMVEAPSTVPRFVELSFELS